LNDIKKGLYPLLMMTQ